MGSTTKGDGELKQAVISIIVVMVAAGIFAGMVLYSVAVMRQTELRILTGEYAEINDAESENVVLRYAQ